MSNGDVAVDGAGAVLDGLEIRGNVDIRAAGVVVRNCRIIETGNSFGVSLRHTSDVTIEHSEIAGPGPGADRLEVGIKDIYGDSTGAQIRANDIHHVSTGVQIESGLIADNYIHDLAYRSGDHLNGTTSNGGGGLPLTIQHNTIFNQWDQTDAVSLFQDFGGQHDRLITNNLLAGGGYTIYGGANPGAARTANIRIVGNRISAKYYSRGGYFGPGTAFDPKGPGNLWTDNIWDHSGQPIASP